MDFLPGQCRREPGPELLARLFDLSLGGLCGVQEHQDRLGVPFRKGCDGLRQEGPSARGDPALGWLVFRAGQAPQEEIYQVTSRQAPQEGPPARQL